MALHFVVATLIVLACYAVGRRFPGPLSRPLLSGPLYGVAAYAVMNYVVVPLSAFKPAPLVWPVLVNGILIHVFGVGIPSVLAARAALGTRNA